VAGETTLYGTLGAHLDLELDRTDLVLGGSYGQSLSGSAGEWVYAWGRWGAGGRVGPAALRLELGGFGLRYLEPFSYDAAGADLLPVAFLPAGRFVVSVRPRLMVGAWSADALSGDLALTGGSIEVERQSGPVTVALSAGALDVENGVTEGSFVDGRLGARWARGDWYALAEVRGQRTPLEDELGGRAGVGWLPAPRFRLHVEGGQTLRDPVFGTPGTVAVAVMVSIRALESRRARAPGLVQIGESSDGGRVVRFSLRAPEASKVDVVGDFTDWDPVPMDRTSDRWTVALTLEPGLHHFGFLVDGQWAVPPDAPGLVDDGWGRRNASIVVEP